MLKISKAQYTYEVTRRVSEKLNLNIHDVKFTFYEYPFKIEAKCNFEDILRLPDFLDLAAMKAYALGRRSKWKDYVDLYFILKYFYSIKQITNKAIEIYDQLFSDKLLNINFHFLKILTIPNL